VVLRRGRATVDIPVTQGGRLIVWTVAAAEAAEGRRAAGAVSATLQGPGGEALEAGRSAGVRRLAIAEAPAGLDLAGAQEALMVEAPAAGLYRLELSGSAAGRAVVTVSAAQPDSALRLTTWSGPLSRQPGQPVTVYAALADGETSLAGARVTARLAGPAGAAGASLRLYDDGRHGDGAAGDGMYAARVPVADQAGLWTVRVEADGRDAAGQSFARTGGSGFVSEPGLARLRPGAIAARVVDDAAGRRVRIQAVADAASAGRYRLEAIVAGRVESDGQRAALAWAERTQTLAAGRNVITLDVPLDAAVGEAGLVDVRLLGLDALGLAGAATLPLR
jgi:hypothetical protein